MQDNFSRWFRETAPYIHTHHGKTFVLSFSPDEMTSQHLSHLIYDVALLRSIGVRLVLSFYSLSFPSVTHSELPKASKNVLPIIDDKQLMEAKEQLGRMLYDLIASLSSGLPDSPMAGSALEVVTGNFITAKPAGIRSGVDHQHFGEIRRIDSGSIQQALEQGKIVVIPPIGYTLTGDIFILDGLALGGHLAAAVQSEKLIFLGDWNDFTDENGALLRQVTHHELDTYLHQHKNQLSNRTFNSAKIALHACEQDVTRMHWVNVTQPDGLLLELFSRDGIGTMLSIDQFDQLRAATHQDIPEIMELIRPYMDDGMVVQRDPTHIARAIDNYFVDVRENTIIACAAIRHTSDVKCAEIFCFAVREEYRNRGHGKRIYHFLERCAQKRGIRKLVVRTTHAEHWFLGHGFEIDSNNMLTLASDSLKKRNPRILVKSL